MNDTQSASGHESANKLYNVKGRKEAIGRGMEECYKLDKQIKEIIDKQVKPLRAAKTDIKARLKDDYQLTVKAFNVRYSAFAFERFARDNGDQVTLDLLTELYEIQPIGGALAFMSVKAPEPKANGAGKPPARPDEPDDDEPKAPSGLFIAAGKKPSAKAVASAEDYGASIFAAALPEPPAQAPQPPDRMVNQELRKAFVRGWHRGKAQHDKQDTAAEPVDEFDEIGEVRDRGRQAFEQTLPDVPDEPTYPPEFAGDAAKSAAFLSGWAQARAEHLGEDVAAVDPAGTDESDPASDADVEEVDEDDEELD